MIPPANHSPHTSRIKRLIRAALVGFLSLTLLVPADFSFAQAITSDTSTTTQGPIRLRQPASGDLSDTGSQSEAARQNVTPGVPRNEPAAEQRPAAEQAPARPDEFESYVQRLAGSSIRRFGSELVTGAEARDAGTALPPDDYLLGPGDEVQLLLWGSVDADLRLRVDRSGRISIPRVGAVTVAGVRYADLTDVIQKRVAQVFRNFQLSVSLGQLRGVRVYVTGFAKRPGAYTVSSLSTIVSALMRAGGPSGAGSFRDIQLKHGKTLISSFDLYDLLLKGDRSADRVVQADDVLYVGPVGPQVALIGSVNKPAIFELKPGDTIDDVLNMAGGFSAVADRSRLGLERLDQRSTTRMTELTLPQAAPQPLLNGDVLRAFSAVEAVLPVARQNKRVRVEGEVARPGDYVLPPNSSIGDALRAAGGFTPSAFVFGTEFERESVRATQQQNYERALRDLETEVAKYNATQRTTSADEAATQASRAAANNQLIERLRAVKPTGRIVLQVTPDASSLPDLALEDGDRLYVPARPTTVGVFGSVFNGGSYLYSDGREVDDFLKLAGGPTRGADAGSTFVLHANGSVVSARQRGGWFGSGNVAGIPALPGDTIFVPEEMNKTTVMQGLKEWSQIFFQFGLGIAAIRTIH